MKVLKQAMQGTVREVTLGWSLPPEVKVTAVPEKVPSIFSGDKLIMYTIMKGAVSIKHYLNTCYRWRIEHCLGVGGGGYPISFP